MSNKILQTLDSYAIEYQTRVLKAVDGQPEEAYGRLAEDEFKRFLADVEIAVVQYCQQAIATNPDQPMMALSATIDVLLEHRNLVGKPI